MIEKYISDREYKIYFQKLNNLRSRIASKLPIKPGMRILDVATGYGFFAIEVAQCANNLKIIGIDISRADIKKATKYVKKQKLHDRVEFLEMDVTKMSFPRGYFDMVVNFLGLEDIHMTRGRAGVQQTFSEVARLLKPNSHFCFVVMPPDKMETKAQKIEVALFSYLCKAKWLNTKEYEDMLKKAKIKLITKRNYSTGKKLTPEQAKKEIRFALKNVPKIYGVKVPSFEKIWTKFGKNIEKNGLGHYSKVLLMTTQKIQENLV